MRARHAHCSSVRIFIRSKRPFARLFLKSSLTHLPLLRVASRTIWKCPTIATPAGSDRKCFICGRPGHFARSCPKPRRQDGWGDNRPRDRSNRGHGASTLTPSGKCENPVGARQPVLPCRASMSPWNYGIP